MSHYPSDVKRLTDEELKILSEEMEQAYSRCNGEGDDCWLDSEAEDRFYEMRAEIRRRWWEAMTPEQQEKWKRDQPQMMQRCIEEMGRALVESLPMIYDISRQFDVQFAGQKIGSTIQIKTPPKFKGVIG